MTQTRRHFLQSSAALAALPLRAFAPSMRAYIGSYSSPQGPEGSIGRGSGIILCDIDSTTGQIRQREVFDNPTNPSWLDFGPKSRVLYSANETGEYQGASSGSVSAYAVDAATGRLTLLNTLPSHGAGPTHLSVHPGGGYVFVANYAGGTVAVLRLKEDGSLDEVTDVHVDTGIIGPKKASSAPKGSFAISGHDRTHAHMILPAPGGKFVLWSDLGLDRLLMAPFDKKTGKLGTPRETPLPPGDGPRHFAFHSNGKWLYSLQEEGSTVARFDYDASTGNLTPRETVSSLPPGFAGTNYTSEIRIRADGRFLYCANRLHDSIAWFAIAENGRLTWHGETWTRGDYPRSFTIDPSSRFLFSCNQRGDAVTTFRVDRTKGALTFTGHYFPAGTPSIVVFPTA